MRNWGRLLAGLLIILIAIVGINTARFRPTRQPDLPPSTVKDDPAAVARLAEAIRIPTVSQETGAADAATLGALHALLLRSFPLVHARLTLEKVAGSSLLYTWTGTDKSLPPLLLLAHQDVVPVEAGSESRWTHPPFAGVVADGAVWGRGSKDDKGMLMAVLESVERQLAAGWQPTRTVILAFGHDEEIGGTGAEAMAGLLKSRGVRPWLVIDEGLAVTEGLLQGVSAPVALIGTAEKGSVSIELTTHAPGGHSSTPPNDNAIVHLSRAIDRLAANPFPARLDQPIAGTFERVGPHMGLGMRAALANLWLTERLVLGQLIKIPSQAASVRTTTAVTIIDAGTKANILPQTARAVVNHRILPGDTVASVLAHDIAAVNDPAVSIKVIAGGRDPTRVSPQGPAFAALEHAIGRTYPKVIIAPSLTVAGTDSRHYGIVSDAIYRFSPMTIRPADLEQIHGNDEHMKIADYMRAIAFYETMLEEGAGK